MGKRKIGKRTPGAIGGRRRAQFGKVAEARFVYEARRRGLSVCVPFGTQEGYDCVVKKGGRLFRVQIKGVHWRRGARAGVEAHACVDVLSRGRVSREFDILAVWLDEQEWILLPAAQVPLRGPSFKASSEERAGREGLGDFRAMTRAWQQSSLSIFKP